MERKPKFNRTNQSIGWAWWSWNPIRGCLGPEGDGKLCTYCYARDMAIRFWGDFEPRFFPERLEAPWNTPVPKTDDPAARNVFTCSMGDMFGDWVAREQIDAVLGAARSAPQWEFLFLTKNPRRLMEAWDWPANVGIGVTVDTQARVEPALEALWWTRYARGCKGPRVLFVSCEPLGEEVSFPLELYIPEMNLTVRSPMAVLDWLIIGGRSESTKMPAAQPKWEWVEWLLVQAREDGVSVYFKDNLTVRPQEFPFQEGGEHGYQDQN